MTQPTISIDELEALLAKNEPMDIEIQPDGSVRAVARGTAVSADVKPMTFKYAVAEFY